MAKRLHYFDFNGLGESIRYLLHYAGIEFEDVRYDHNKWPAIKGSANFPFGQLPVYEEGDRRMNQSIAILRYLGHTNNLSTGDAWRDAQLDAAALTINDFWGKFGEIFQAQGDNEKKALVKKKFLEEHVDFFFSRFEKQLKDNGGFLGGKLTWVDFLIVGLIEATNLFLNTRIEEKYPTVQALISKIHSYPGVKKYVATRKQYKSHVDL